MNDETMPFIVSTPSRPEKPTLRDQFAMAALTGLIGSGKSWDSNKGRRCAAVSRSVTAYKYADAMIAERNKQDKLHK